jgi:hypothetical protein
MDEELLTCYMKGFKDELYGTSTEVYDVELKNRAYRLGAQHAIIGDDVRSVDYLTNEEILKMIKK